MNLKAVVFIIAGTTAVAAAGLIFTLFYVNPFEGWIAGLVLFYGTFFVTVLGVVSLVGLAVRSMLSPAARQSRAALRSVREGALASLVAVSLLVLSHGNLLNILNGLVLVVLAIVIEYLFITLEKPRTV